MFIRYAISIVIGTAVTFGLLYTMHLMIDTGRPVMSAAETTRFIDFVRVERSTTVETREPKPERPPEPEARPETPAPTRDTGASNMLTVSLAAPAIDAAAPSMAGLGAVSDGEYLPVVKVAPVYPTRALQRRMEGAVIVEFTVTSAGAVKDVAVVESTAPIFEDAAIEAALRFKYKPRVIDGVAVEVLGVRNRIVFTLDQSQRVAAVRAD